MNFGKHSTTDQGDTQVTRPTKASSTASTPRRAIGPGRLFRGAFATRRAAGDARGTCAPSLRPAGLLALALAAALLLGVSSASAAAPTVTVESASQVGFTTAQVKGTVNPADHNTGYRFDFATQAQWEANGESFNGAFSSAGGNGLAENSGEASVETTLENLTADTTYHLRLFAENDQAEPAEAIAASTFTTQAATPPALSVKAPEPSYLKAQLAATIDPEGGNVNPIGLTAVPIAWDLQFSLSGEPGTWASTGGGVLSGTEAESNAPIEVQGDATGLAPSTPYITRLVVNYAGIETIAAEEPGFETLTVAKPTIANLQVGPPSAHTATFTAEVNPNAPKAQGSTSEAEQEAFLTRYHFQCEPECPGLEGEVPAGKDPEEVSKEATGLIPGHNYEVSLFASNAGGQETAGPVEFTTEALPPQIDATFTSSVGETEATLKAKVNPGGAATTFHFEYLTAQQFEDEGGFASPETKRAPEPDGAVGADVEDHTVEATVEGLEPNTAYRYRVVATNEKSPAGLPGPTKGFLTAAAPAASSACPNEALRRQNNSTALPDCRAYEMVSPVAKEGFDATSRASILQYPAQAAPSGEAVAYQGYGPFVGAPANLFPNAHLSSRTSGGWQTVDVTPPTPNPTLPFGASAAITEFSFSEDLSQQVVMVPGQALTDLPAGNEGLFNLFLRKADGSYSLVNSAPPTEFPPPGAECYEFSRCFAEFDLIAFAGASSDFEHVFFEANDSLVGTGAPGGFVSNLYESSGGQLQVVGVLPDGELAPSGAVPGSGGGGFFGGFYGEWLNVDRAVSADGKRVLFSAVADGGQPAPAQNGLTELYDRIEGNETIEVSAPAPGATPANPAPQPAQFWNASEDGSLVFFTSAAELTTPSNTGTANNSEDLYRYNVDTETLTDLSVDTNPVDAATGAGVQGVVGASTDGSYVYFVASGELLPGEGEDGQPNLYVSHRGQLEFIATLGAGDSRDWTSRPRELQAYLTPDGHHLAFMSRQSLTGYDNTDQASGAADTEVFAYQAPEGAGPGTLVCASCDPSGARPTGRAFIGAGPDFLASTPFHQPRAVSDSGQVFFSSPGPLIHGQVSANAKLYEYEPDGVGGCAAKAGCISAISSEAGTAPTVFLDAGADGRDVFFATLSHLTPTDEDNLFDVYDARIGGGFAPPQPPPPCEGEGCIGAASTAPPGAAKATATFNGREEGPKHPRCGKRQARRRGRCVRRKHHAKKRSSSHMRAANNNRGGAK
jgi:hypothetical protein